MAFATPLPLTRAPAPSPVCAPARRVAIRAAKHVQFKGAKKADRRRPKKHRPSDIHRAKPSFVVEPLRAEGLPAVYDVFKPDDADAAFAGTATLIDEAMVKELEDTFVAASTEPTEPAEPAESPESPESPESTE